MGKIYYSSESDGLTHARLQVNFKEAIYSFRTLFWNYFSSKTIQIHSVRKITGTEGLMSGNVPNIMFEPYMGLQLEGSKAPLVTLLVNPKHQVNQSLRYTISNWKFLKTYILLFRLIRRDWT